MSYWKETAPGRFERPFDSIELFFLTLARATAPIKREHWSLNIVAQFRAQLAHDEVLRRLKNAWITMRYDHPEIACKAEGDMKVYEVPDALALDAWLQETFVVAADTAKVEDVIASFQPQSLASIHFFPHSWEILIHTSHWRTDGNGSISLLNNFFKAVGKSRSVEFGHEGKNLSPGRDEAASFTTAGVGGDESQFTQTATELISTYTDNMPSIGLPDNLEAVMPLGTRRVEQQFDAKTTSKIVSACKEIDLSVTMAFHAAMIQATQQLTSKKTSANKYTSFVIFSLRPGMPSPFNDSAAYATSVYIIGLPLVISPSTFRQNIVQLRDFYKQPLPPSAESNLAPIVIPYSRGMTELAKKPPNPDVPASTEPTLSSLGVVDRWLESVHGDVEITGFAVGVEMDTRQIVCHLLTWRGKMVLSACYNEAFYEAQFVRDFLARTSDISFAELGVDRIGVTGNM